MAKIGKNDIFDEDFLKFISEVKIELDQLLKTFKDLGREARDIQSAFKGAKSFNEVSEAAKRAAGNVDRMTAEEKELHRIQKLVERETTKAATALSKESVELQKAREQTRRATAEARKLAKEQLGGVKSTNQWSKALGSFQFKFNALGNIAANVVSRLTRYFKDFVRSGIDAYDVQIKAETQLLTALNNRVSVQQRLMRQASELQKITLFGDEETIRAQALIAAFVREGDQIERIIPLVQDLAIAKQMDLASAADLVAKTLGSSTDALSRYGIKTTGAVGSTERLDSLIKGLTDHFYGQAQAAAEVDIKMTQMKNAFGDVKEAVVHGTTSTVTFGKALGWVKKQMEDASTAWNLLADPQRGAALEALDRYTKELGEDTEAYTNKISELEKEMQALNNRLWDTDGLSKKEIKNITQKSETYKLLIQLMKDERDILIGGGSAQEVEIKTIGTLKEELKSLSTLKENVAISEVAAINIRIRALEDEIRLYEKLGLEVIPKVKEITDEISDPDIYDDYLASLEFKADADQEYTREFIKLAVERFNAEDKLAKESSDKKLKIEADAEDERERLRQIRVERERQAIDIITSLSSAYFDLQQAKMDAELDQAGDNAKARAIIEKKWNKKRQQDMRSQTYINIAAGIARAFVDYGFTVAGIAAAAAVGVEGGLQIAAINAQKFAKGTKSSPEGYHYVGEKGAELRIDPKGGVSLTPDTESLTYLQKGTQIVPADITEQFLKYSYVKSAMPGQDEKIIEQIMQRLEKSNDRLAREIRHKPVVQSTLTPGGIFTATIRGNTTIKKMDKYFK